ncbi:MAG: PepSY domain-containing protein, partial [Clostridia bacterium]|nr:PepSY domain-containing protein [Clostridia bacterium]
TDGIISGRYVVNARTGDIIQHSITKEYHDRSVRSAVIGNFEAKRIALAKDGLIDGKVSKYEMNLKADGEEYVYVLSFICNATRYNVRIDAESGTVLSFEKTVLKDTGAPSVETEASVSAEK